jgi:hypothetical protein
MDMLVSQRRTLSLVVLLVSLLFTSHVIEAEFSINRVTSCVDNLVKRQPLKKKRTKVEKPLMINFGHSGVEAVTVLGPSIIQQINALAECVQLESPGLHYRLAKR